MPPGAARRKPDSEAGFFVIPAKWEYIAGNIGHGTDVR